MVWVASSFLYQIVLIARPVQKLRQDADGRFLHLHRLALVFCEIRQARDPRPRRPEEVVERQTRRMRRGPRILLQ